MNYNYVKTNYSTHASSMGKDLYRMNPADKTTFVYNIGNINNNIFKFSFTRDIYTCLRFVQELYEINMHHSLIPRPNVMISLKISQNQKFTRSFIIIITC